MPTLNLGDVDLQQWVIVLGNLADSYVVVGPFEAYEAAKDYIKTDPEMTPANCRIVPLDLPAEDNDD